MLRFHYLLFLAFAIGCSSSSAPPESVESGSSADATSTDAASSTTAASDSEMELKLVDASQFAAEMAARKGNVVLLDMWATW